MVDGGGMEWESEVGWIGWGRGVDWLGFWGGVWRGGQY